MWIVTHQHTITNVYAKFGMHKFKHDKVMVRTQILAPGSKPPYLPDPRGITPQMWIATHHHAKMNVYAKFDVRKLKHD